jgi:hypothetical protein
MALLSAEDKDFEKMSPYGVPYLMGKAHHHALLLLHHCARAP